jgi:hypothetical protein
MKTVLLAQDREPDAPSVCRCRWHDRMRARLSSLRLDRELASGACPDVSILLSLRAEELIRVSNRHGLAKALRRVVRDAQCPPRAPGPVLPLARRDIKRHRNLILELADVIDCATPVDLRGLAAVEVLLRDGGGPLYSGDRVDALGPRLEAVLRVLTTPPAGSTVA